MHLLNKCWGATASWGALCSCSEPSISYKCLSSQLQVLELCDTFWDGKKGKLILGSTLQMWYGVQMGLFWIHIGLAQLLLRVFVNWSAEKSECLGGMGSSLKKFWVCIIVCCCTILINWTCGLWWRLPVCSSEQYGSWLLCFNSAKLDCGSLGSLLLQWCGGISVKYPPLLRLVEGLWNLTRLVFSLLCL